VGIGLAVWHRQAARPGRASILGVSAAALFTTYVDAYHFEPRMLRVREHPIEWSSRDSEARTLRILHVTDIQSPIIGPHEERALLAGLDPASCLSRSRHGKRLRTPRTLPLSTGDLCARRAAHRPTTDALSQKPEGGTLREIGVRGARR
jgi:hypothetical protein